MRQHCYNFHGMSASKRYFTKSHVLIPGMLRHQLWGYPNLSARRNVPYFRLPYALPRWHHRLLGDLNFFWGMSIEPTSSIAPGFTDWNVFTSYQGPWESSIEEVLCYNEWGVQVPCAESIAWIAGPIIGALLIITLLGREDQDSRTVVSVVCCCTGGGGGSSNLPQDVHSTNGPVGRWLSGLSECTNQCCLATWCPCVAYGRNMAAIDGHNDWAPGCCIYIV